MRFIRSLADVENPRSLSNRLRARRFDHFTALAEGVGRPLRVIDLGGTVSFWQRRGWAGRSDVHITLVNLSPQLSVYSNITSVQGDVTALTRYAPGSFDVAFSNSVIEHLTTSERQASMAAEMRRLSPRYWLQTPNYWFPIEPHFHIPGWQWMPIGVRASLIRRFRCGWRGPCPDPGAAWQTVREVRLLTRRQLQELFPGSIITPERFAGLTKSWIVHHGFDRHAQRRIAA